MLAVTVTYTDAVKATEGENDEAQERSGRVRTFRKLYQFVAQQCLTVRTKNTDITALDGDAGGKGGKLIRAVLEAQLENMGDDPITLEVLAPFISNFKTPS